MPKDQTPTSDAAITAGTKRKREDLDILAGLDLHDVHVPRTDFEDRPRRLRLLKGKEAALQAGCYALELLSCTYGTRMFCHSTILEDDLLVFVYSDACGMIYTKQRLSLIEDFEKAAAIIVALTRCTPEHFGAFPISVLRPSKPSLELFPPSNLSGNILRVKHPITKKQIRVTLKDSLYAQYVLSGRRTFAYTMKASPQLSKEGLMVKFSYQVNTLRPEYELISIAREAGVRHLPDTHMWADLWKMSDGARRIFYGGGERKAGYENRTLRMIVSTEYGSIQMLFSERCELMPVMVDQMVKCEHVFYRLQVDANATSSTQRFA